MNIKRLQLKIKQLLSWMLISVFFSGCGSSSNSGSDNTKVKLPTQASTKTILVACVGDSITQGVGIPNILDTYPAQLARLLGEGWEVENFGLKSATLMHTGHKPYSQSTQFHTSKKYNPDIVVIMLGTNDSKKHNWTKQHHFISDYKNLIKPYQDLPNQPRVYICYPPTVKNSISGISNQRIKYEVIPKINQVSLDNLVPIIDTHTVFHQKKGLFTDDVHPNKHGAREIAQAVYRVIY